MYMSTLMKVMVALVNNIHDYIIKILKIFMPSLNDKDLHFIVIGIIGLIIFIVTDYIFKKISKWNVSIISFIYTFTVLVVIVFSIEIEQKITKRGNMEFADIVAGLWGFFAMMAAYILLKIIFYAIYKSTKKYKTHSQKYIK